MVFFTRIHRPPLPLPWLVVVSQSHPAIPQTAFFSIDPRPRRIDTKSRRWDSNAETFRRQSFDSESMDDDDDTGQWLDVLEDFIDGVWIFKAFRSYGWMLPAIISSLLLTSGPKAFLMALALPLVQSALSLAFQLVLGRPKNKTKRRNKRKPSPYADADDEERKRAGGWVAGNDKKSSNASSSSFGGWEELDTHNSKGKGKGKPSKINLNRRERRGETPLLLRLLIAVFPFLGSWTRFL